MTSLSVCGPWRRRPLCSALVPTTRRLTKGTSNHNINADLGYAKRPPENEGKVSGRGRVRLSRGLFSNPYHRIGPRLRPAHGDGGVTGRILSLRSEISLILNSRVIYIDSYQRHSRRIRLTQACRTRREACHVRGSHRGIHCTCEDRIPPWERVRKPNPLPLTSPGCFGFSETRRRNEALGVKKIKKTTFQPARYYSFLYFPLPLIW